MLCTTTDTIAGRKIRHEGLLHASAVSGANVVRDIREAITNVVGGQMNRYEYVLDQTIERAIGMICDKARERGYDGIVGLKISHPHITDGAIEVVVSGTGFRFDGD